MDRPFTDRDHLIDSVDDDTDVLAIDLHNNDAALVGRLVRFHLETLAQVDDRAELARRLMTPSMNSGAFGTRVISCIRMISRTEPMSTP